MSKSATSVGPWVCFKFNGACAVKKCILSSNGNAYFSLHKSWKSVSTEVVRISFFLAVTKIHFLLFNEIQSILQSLGFVFESRYVNCY